jgi:hypothetical protein
MRRSDSKNSTSLIDPSTIEEKILVVRGHKVLLDQDLAKVYGVETRVLNQAVRRNIERFPEDFLLELTLVETREIESLRSQTVTLKTAGTRGRHSKYASHAFTEHGAVMLATILKSQRAIDASIEVVRAFIRLRTVLSEHKELARKIDHLERKYDERFKVVFVAIKQLMAPNKRSEKTIGFIGAKDKKIKSK